MAKKKKDRSGKNPSSRKVGKPQGGGAPRDSTVSLSAFRAEKLLAPMVPGFVEWFEEDEGTPGEALDCLKIIGMVLAEFFGVASTPSVTSFTAEDAGLVLEGLEEVLGEDIVVVAEMFHLYLDFLHERGLWSGSEEEFDQLHTLFGDGQEVPWPELPEIAVPKIPQDKELEAFEDMPLIRHVNALIEWIGSGKAVTSTGVLRLADIEAAAACVGVTARGVRQAPKGDDLVLPGMEALGNQDPQNPTLQVRTMHEVPILNMVWHCMLEAKLLEIRSTKVVPREGNSLDAQSTAAARLDAYRNVATACLRVWEEEASKATMLGPSLWLMHEMAFSLGCSDTPMPVEKLELNVESAKDDDEFLMIAMAQMSLDQFREMEKLGLVSLDTHLRVPRHLWRSVKTVFADELDDAHGYFDFSGGDGWTDIALRSHGESGAQASVFQLKIMLQDSKPPVWRRVLVSSDESLYGFHNLIQAVFDWDDSHLHLFEKGGRNGTRYSSGYVEESPWEEPHVDEHTTSLAEVLGREGDRIDYEYDFGDDWRHRITLEKVLDAEDVSKVPWCTGGRGMTPAEDSGGIWGWTNMVQAANDPGHPEHHDYREWLGLEDGEALDPKAFDKDGINKVLQRD